MLKLSGSLRNIQYCNELRKAIRLVQPFRRHLANKKSQDEAIEPIKSDKRSEHKYEKYLAEKFKGDDLGHVSPYARLPVKNVPFIKSLYKGNYEVDYLKFPENPISTNAIEFEECHVKPLHEYVGQAVANHKFVDATTGKFGDEAQRKLIAELSMTHSQMPKQKQARLLEATAVYPSFGMQWIYGNSIGAQLIETYGSDELKNKYMTRIRSGEIKVAYCYTESSTGIDVSRFDSIARYSYVPGEKENEKLTQKKLVLNGKKTWTSVLTSDASIDLVNEKDVLFVVLARTKISVDRDIEVEPINSNTANEQYEAIRNRTGEQLMALVVDRREAQAANPNSISIQRSLYDSASGLSLYDIEFKNTETNESYLLNDKTNSLDTHSIALKAYEDARYLVGVLSVGLLKQVYKETLDYARASRQFRRTVHAFPIIKNRLCNIETRLYAMESMCYLTAGIYDSYEEPDVSLESALTKIYCTEELASSMHDCLQIMAMTSHASSVRDRFNRYIRDSNYLLHMLNTNDSLRTYVTIQGLIHAGLSMNEEVTKMRNPLLFPAFVFSQMVKNYRLVRSVSPLFKRRSSAPSHFYLWEHLHPSLHESAVILEQTAVRFVMAVKSSFVTRGGDIVDDQLNLKRLADISAEIYAMNAMLARASRAYSIGLPNANHEMAMCDLYTHQIQSKLTPLFKDIIETSTGFNKDNLKLNIAEQAIKAGAHAATHSISRNY